MIQLRLGCRHWSSTFQPPEQCKPVLQLGSVSRLRLGTDVASCDGKGSCQSDKKTFGKTARSSKQNRKILEVLCSGAELFQELGSCWSCRGHLLCLALHRPVLPPRLIQRDLVPQNFQRPSRSKKDWSLRLVWVRSISRPETGSISGSFHARARSGLQGSGKRFGPCPNLGELSGCDACSTCGLRCSVKGGKDACSLAGARRNSPPELAMAHFCRAWMTTSSSCRGCVAL